MSSPPLAMPSCMVERCAQAIGLLEPRRVPAQSEVVAMGGLHPV